MLFISNFNCSYQLIKMAMPMFTRFVNVQNTIKINKFGAVGYSLSVTQHSDVIPKSYCTQIIDHNVDELFPTDDQKLPEKKLSRAMKLYLQRARDYTQLIEKQVAEYNIGKRHLANMMGEDPDKFTQKDVNKAIAYLFPSGLYDKKARPMMKDPVELYGHKKEAEFDEDGRPHHFLYYTARPNYYEALHNIVELMNHLNEIENKKMAPHISNTPETKLNISGSEWINKAELEEMLTETLKTAEYNYFITSMQRLIEHPLSKHAETFVMKYRKSVSNIVQKIKRVKPKYDSDNRPFIVVDKLWRKNSRGQVKVIGNGTGKININGKDITYFDNIQCREQVIFPLIFTNMSDKVDVEATVYEGGPTGQAGVIRLGIARALQSFVSLEMVERMRLAGLLSYDLRLRERKKPGQEGARRKFTWKRR